MNTPLVYQNRGTLSLIDPEIDLAEVLLRAFRKKLPPRESIIDFSKIALIVPTRRFSTFIAASLAKNLGSMHPPKIATWDEWIKPVGDRQNTNTTLSTDQSGIIIGLLIAQGGYLHIQERHTAEILQFFAEAQETGDALGILDCLQKKIREDIYKNDAHQGSLEKRFAELKHLFISFQQILMQKNLNTPSMAAMQGIHHMLSQEADDLAGFEHVWIAGLTSLKPYVYPLITKLLQNSKVTLWLHRGPKSSPLDDIIQVATHAGATVVCEESATRTYDATFLEPANSSPNTALSCYISLPTPLAEIKHAVSRVKDYIRQGIPASQIALIVTKEVDYAEPLRMHLKFENIPINLALTKKFHWTPPGLALGAIFDFFAKKNLLSLLSQPLIQELAGINVDEFQIVVGALENLNSQVIEALLEDRLGGIELSSEPAFAAVVPKIQEFLSKLQFNKMRGSPHLIKDWNVWLCTITDSLITTFETLNQSQEILSEDLFMSMQDTYETLKSGLKVCHDSQVPLSFSQYWQLIGQRLLAQDIRSWGEPLWGVQILSLAESRNMPFVVGIVLGCREGSFPQAVPKDELIDDYLKRGVGLLGWQHLEKMEDLTFFLLRSRVQQLILSSCQSVNGEAQIKSRFIEQLLGKGLCTEISAIDDKAKSLSKKPHLQRCSPPSRLASLPFSTGSKTPPHPEAAVATPNPTPTPAKQPIREGLWDAPASDLITTIAATSLKTLLECPYRYRLNRTRLRAEPLLPKLFDPRKEGSWLHSVTQHFMNRLRDTNLEHLQKLNTYDRWLNEGLEVLEMLTTHWGPPQIKSSTLGLQLRHESWPRYLQHLWHLYQLPQGLANLKKVQTERALANSPLQMRGVTRTLRGSIDRIDTCGSLIIITDYKRRTPPPLSQLKAGKIPQLALYALSLQLDTHQSLDHMLLGYWNIIEGDWQAVAAGSEVRSELAARSLVSAATLDTKDFVDICLQTWKNQEENIEARGGFFADPRVCDYCDYAGICRRDDPPLQT